jgi:hypothetical protein
MKAEDFKLDKDDLELVIRILTWCQIATVAGDDQKLQVEKILFKLRRLKDKLQVSSTDPI